MSYLSFISGSSINQNAFDIYTNLIAYWEYEQNNSDTFFDDVHSTHNLTIRSGTSSSNSSAGGIKSRSTSSYQLNSNTGLYVPRSDSTFDFGDTDFSIAFWVKDSGNMVGFDRDVNYIGRHYNSSTFSYCIVARYLFPAGESRKAILRDSSNASSTTLDIGGLVDNTWTLLVLVHDSINNEFRAYNNTTKYSTSHSGGVYSGGNQNFCVGSASTSDTTVNTTSDAVSAYFDETLVVGRALTDSDVAYLYASGAGKTYAQIKSEAGF